jgi:hypothetical protein
MQNKSLTRFLLFTVTVNAIFISTQPLIVYGGRLDSESITGLVWKWEQRLYNNDQKAL